MAKAKHKGGRPVAANPLRHKHMIRLDDRDEDDAQQDIERLTLLTGTQWDMGKYTRMCLRAMKGKHLP